ncbi:hypothetical protein [Pseudomonas sp. S2_C03]
MDWLQFFSSIISSLAWPTAVLGLALLMRHPLAKLIPMVRTLKYKDLHIDLSEKLEAVKDELVAQTPANDPLLPFVPPPSVLELARIDPRAAILGAWVDVERATMEYATKAGISPNGSLITIANELHVMDAISDLEFDTLRKLRRIRNDAVHLSNHQVSYEEAVNMADMCQWLAHRLKMLTSGLPSGVSAQNKVQ